MQYDVAKIETTLSSVSDPSFDRYVDRRIFYLVQEWRKKKRSTRHFCSVTVNLQLIVIIKSFEILIHYDFDSDRSFRNQKDYIDGRGIHVVVGHYIGDSVDPLKTPNITKGN